MKLSFFQNITLRLYSKFITKETITKDLSEQYDYLRDHATKLKEAGFFLDQPDYKEKLLNR